MGSSTDPCDRPPVTTTTTTTPRGVSASTGRSVRSDREARTSDLLHRAFTTLDGDLAEGLRTAAVHLNLVLAHGIAGRYTGRGVERDDLNQVAALGLVLATNRYDPHQENPFTPYATVTIHGELKRHLRDRAWAVRPPRKLHDTYLQVMGVMEDLGQTLSSTPTVGDIAQTLGITVEEVREARRVSQSYTATSIDALQDEYGDAPLGALGTTDERHGADALLTRLVLREGVQALSARDQMILHLRFEEELTQQQIGARLGISQMQISRLLTAITARLRAHLQSDDLDRSGVHPLPTRQPKTHPTAVEPIAS